MKHRHLLPALALTLLSALLPDAAQAQTPGTAEAPAYLNACTPIDMTTPVTDAQRETALYGKTLVIIGDSYVRNHRGRIEDTWHYRVAQKYHMPYYNYGKNGNCIAFDRPRWGVAMLHRYQEMRPDADYVIVVAGHNDADYMELRDMDTASMSTREKARLRAELRTQFRDSLTAFVDALIARYPAARLAFVTPWNVGRAGFADMHRILTEVLASRSVPYFDAAHRSGIYVNDAAFRRRFFQGPDDTAHLNPDGHRLVQNKLETFLLGL